MLFALAPGLTRAAEPEAPPAETTSAPEVAQVVPPADAPPPPPPPPPPTTTSVEMQAPPMAVPPAPPPPPEQMPMPTQPPPPVLEKTDGKTLDVGVGIRTGLRLQSGSEPDAMNDISLDTLLLEPRFSGSVHRNVKWQANLVVTPFGETFALDTVSLMDLIAKFEIHSLFNIWLGRMLVPSDRSNFSGPWFMSAWNYPGVYGPVYVGPKTGPFGRDNGAVVWGDVAGGKLKYYFGAFGLENVAASPMFAGRLNVALIGEEPGYYHSSTYYGAKDIVAIGGGFEAQNAGSGMDPATGGPGDLLVLNADILAEKNLGGAGVITAEVAYYKYDEFQPRKHAYFVLASYLFPQALGVGQLQPLVRLQQALPQDSSAPTWTIIDAFVTYVVDAYNMRVALGYQRTDLGGDIVGNAIQLGVQIQK
jgi:hypothetical protein